MFSQLWNAVINSLWKEDYISNSEMELLLIPYPFNQRMRYIQWPPFLLANKVKFVRFLLKFLLATCIKMSSYGEAVRVFPGNTLEETMPTLVMIKSMYFIHILKWWKITYYQPIVS